MTPTDPTPSTKEQKMPFLSNDDIHRDIPPKAFDHFSKHMDRIKGHGDFGLGAWAAAEVTRDIYEAELARLRSLVGELASNLRQSDDTLKLEMDWGGHSDLRKANAAALLRAKEEGFNHEEQK